MTIDSWKKVFICIMILTVPICILFCQKSFHRSDKICINEVCASNSEVSFLYKDERVISDYIEIYNEGSIKYSDTLYLSDDENNLLKFKLKRISINPKECKVIALDEMSFGINKTEETIYLSDRYGVIDSIQINNLEKNTAYSRIPNGASSWCVSHCSPGKDNYIVDESIKKPQFSVPTGCYAKEFCLEITSQPGNSIYYTLDGSEPNENSIEYVDSIRVYDKSDEENIYRSVKRVVDEWLDKEVGKDKVDKAFVVRAIAVSETGHRSEVVTANYVIGKTEYENKDILFINADGEELLGANGIYTVGTKYDDWYLNGMSGEYVSPLFFKHGRQNEISANLTLLSNNREVVSQNAGIRVSGGDHRRLELKRLSTFSREYYSGNRFFDKLFMPDAKALHSMGIRYGDANAFLQQYMLDDANLLGLSSRRVYTFINGEFFYTAYLIERYDDEYFINHLNVGKNDFIFVKDNSVNTGLEKDIEDFERIRKYVQENDLSDQRKYEEFESFFDIDSYIDFICFCTYFKDMDVEELTRNVVLFKTRAKYDEALADGRWHYALQDLDNPGENNSKHYNLEHDYTVDSFSLRYKNKDSRIAFNEGDIFVALKNNEKFKERFVARFRELVNSKFSADVIIPAIDEFNADSSEMDYFREFCEHREEYIVGYMEKEFGLCGNNVK